MRRCLRAFGPAALLASLSIAWGAPALAANDAGQPRWAITSVAGPTYFKPSPNLQLEGEVTEQSKFVKGLSSTANIVAGVGIKGAKVQSGTTVEKVINSTEVELSNPIEGEGEAQLKEPLALLGAGLYLVTATNVGGESTSGPIMITDTLEGEVEATSIAPPHSQEGEFGDAFSANPLIGSSGSPLNCTISGPRSITCSYAGAAPPGDTLTVRVNVNYTAQTGVINNTATVSGGGAESAMTSEPTTRPTPVTAEPVPFGVATFSATASTRAAGAHPNFTTSLAPNWGELREDGPFPSESPREIGVDLPPGLTGDALAVPRCDIDSVRRERCPETAAVGIAVVRIQQGAQEKQLVYSITPYPDEPAALAFTINRGVATARLDTKVVLNSNGEYAVQVSVPDINESAALLASSVTLWGVPSRYNGPGPDITSECGSGTCRTFGGEGDKTPEDEKYDEKPFMRNQTSCTDSPVVALNMRSWQKPEVLRGAESPLPAPTECNVLSPLFKPTLEVAPDKSTEIAPQTYQAGAPAGYEVHLSVPQPEKISEQPRATPDLRNSSITLPVGTVASPSAANGLEACSDAQFDRSSLEAARCSLRSEIGKLEIKTPLLDAALKGQVFLGEPQCSPCGASEAAEGKMTRLFLQAQGSGVRVKLAGRTEINQENGQLTTIFEENPQQPFELLTLKLDGGPGAALANSSSCGAATTVSRLVPWSATAESPFTAEPNSTFQVGGCTTAFAPSFSAGTTGTSQAGAYSPLSVTFSRSDQDQIFSGITTQTPPGLLGAVSHVTQCGEPQASQGTCGPESQIGTVAAAAGPGPTPFWITDGRAYLTGPYNRAPFGLSIVVPTVAGPFNLGEEHLRARIFVDPYTSAITVVSDPLPTKKDGIPFQVRTVNVNINRPQFIFNATNCNAMAIGATISSTQGAVARVPSPYQAHGCESLPFRPEFTAEVGGHGSKANGTSFIVKVKARPGDANIAKTFLQLPIALPSRLDTIQKACPAATFEANPASCDEGSNIGTAVAHTPLLNSPLAGLAYLVSHGNAAFPDVEFVLHGEGVTLILDGKTDIKNGITYSRFETVPDAPVSTFETVLPAGPHSALTIFAPGRDHYSACSTTLLMPTEITGQNGAVIKQNTRIKVTGCTTAAKPKVTIGKIRIKGNTLLVTVKTSAKGTVRVTGNGLKRTIKKNLAAGRHQIRVPLSKAGRNMRKHRKRTTVHVSLTAGGQSVAKATRLRL
jgi:hypothetical protein